MEADPSGAARARIRSATQIGRLIRVTTRIDRSVSTSTGPAPPDTKTPGGPVDILKTCTPVRVVSTQAVTESGAGRRAAAGPSQLSSESFAVRRRRPGHTQAGRAAVEGASRAGRALPVRLAASAARPG